MRRLIRVSLLAALGACACSASAAEFAVPSETELVQVQGSFARVQLRLLAALYSPMPAAAAKEAFASGNATIDWTRHSPALRGVNRGPTLSESIAPLLANVAAARSACPDLEGPCEAAAWRRAQAWSGSILAARHPGKALAAILEEVDHE